MPQVAVKYTGDVTQASAQIKKLARDQKGVEQAAKGITAATRQTDRAQQQWARAAQRAVDRSHSATERYRLSMQALGRDMMRGKYTQEEVARASAHLKTQYERAEAAGQKAFGPGSLATLAKYAVGFVGVSKAIGLARQALQEMVALEKEAAEKLRESRMPRGELAQLATSPAHFRQLQMQAKEIFRAGGADTMEEAEQLLFSAVSAGFGKDVHLLTQMRATGMFRDPGRMSAAAAALRSTMGVRETGDFRGIVSKALAASAGSPARAEELLLAAGESGSTAGMLGISDEEVLAALSITATATGEARKGGTQVTRLTTSLVKMQEKQAEAVGDGIAQYFEGAPGMGALGAAKKQKPTFDFKGKSLMQMIEEIEQEGLSEPELLELLGDIRAVKGFVAVASNKEQYAKMLAQVQAAPARDIVGQRLRYYADDPALVAARRAAEAKAAVEIAREPTAIARTYAEAYMDECEVEGRRQGYSRFELWMERWWRDWAYTLQGTQGAQVDYSLFTGGRRETGYRRPLPAQMPEAPQAYKDLQAAAEKLDQAADKQLRAAAGPTLSNPDRDR